jgi:cell division transport system ATP-binding protein
VSENVAYALQVIGKSRAFIDTAVPDVLRLVGLEHKKDSLPTNLSGGEQQRVAIARALVNKPELLLADEPTGNLDPDNSHDVMRLLEKINLSGTTIVMATHDRGIVDRMKRRVVEIQDGRIIRDANSASYKGMANQETQQDSRSSN